MLGKERFLAIKKLAKDIREDNEKLFEALSKEKPEKQLKEKEEFIDSVIDSMDIAFSSGEKGKEEKQIFRANVLIPNDLDFYEDYSKDKNIRNLMNKYSASIDDIMSKITELNLYGKYIDKFNDDENASLVESPSFVDEMVKISPKEAGALLDEIDSMSNAIDDLDLKAKELKPTSLLEPEEIEEKDEFDDIENALSGFVEEYGDLEENLKNKEEEIKNLNEEIIKLKDLNSELEGKQKEKEEEIFKLVEENKNLNNKIQKMSALLQKIHKIIPKHKED